MPNLTRDGHEHRRRAPYHLVLPPARSGAFIQYRHTERATAKANAETEHRPPQLHKELPIKVRTHTERAPEHFERRADGRNHRRFESLPAEHKASPKYRAPGLPPELPRTPNTAGETSLPRAIVIIIHFSNDFPLYNQMIYSPQ